MCSILFKVEGKVPQDFLGTVGFSLRMDGRYLVFTRHLTGKTSPYKIYLYNWTSTVEQQSVGVESCDAAEVYVRWISAYIP